MRLKLASGFLWLCRCALVQGYNTGVNDRRCADGFAQLFTGWPARSEPLALWAPCFPLFWHFSCKKKSVFLGIVLWRREAQKGKMFMSALGTPLMKNDPRHKKCDTTADACTSSIDNTPKKETAHPCTTFAPKHVFVSCFATRMVLSGQELFAIEKMATASMGNKRIATTLGLPLSTTKRWLVSTARQCCRTQSSFNRLALQICLPQTLVERAQNTVRPASSSCPSRRLAGTFDPRVSQNVDRQALDVEKMGAPWVRKLKAFLNSDPGTSHCAAQRRCTKTRH